MDESLTRLVQDRLGHGQALTQGLLRVKTQALGIRHSDKKEIEGTSRMAEVIDQMLTDQALIHPAELLGNRPEFGQRDGTFVHRGCLL